MNYAALERLETDPGLWNADHIPQLIADQKKALEVLFLIATGTSCAEGKARSGLVSLGVFQGKPLVNCCDAGFLMGYNQDEARVCLRREEQIRILPRKQTT